MADPTWQGRAVDRSLGDARKKALETSARFIAAAGHLLNGTGRIDFTVQAVIDESGQSLRAFYQHFAGKDELLLALFEEVMVGFAADLRAAVDQHGAPLAQLEAYVRRFHELVEAADGAGARALSTYHLRLAQDRPDDFAAALGPQITLLAEIVDSGVAAPSATTSPPPLWCSS